MAAVGGLSVWAARRRQEREEALVRMTRVAEVAQGTILRPVPAACGPVALAARYVSASAEALVGGDLYDVAETPAGVRLVVGDVRGKGLEAVRLAAAVLGSFRHAAFDQEHLTDVAAALDATVVRTGGPEDFVTAVLVEVGTDGTATVANCGHPPPLRVGPWGVALLEVPPAFPLGLGSEPHVAVCPLAPGERLLLYTDGLAEARDERGAFLPLEAAAAALVGVGLEDALDRLLARLRDHVGSGFADDLALMLVERRA